MRLINADALIEQLPEASADIFENCGRCTLLSRDDVVEIINDAPTVDPVKHGEWVINLQGNWACSLCGNDPYHSNMENMNYCPNCGAKNIRRGKDESK